MIGFKAPGNCSDQFWSNEYSVLSCEGPKPQTPMFFRFLNPKESLLMDFNIPNYFKQYKRRWKHFLEIRCLQFCESTERFLFLGIACNSLVETLKFGFMELPNFYKFESSKLFESETLKLSHIAT